jgi:hypothetical protein
MAVMPTVEFASVLAGAEGFSEGNINDTYRGQVLRADGAIVNAVLKDVGARELANELISFVLARSLSLPTPDALLAQVHPDDLEVTGGPITSDGRRLMLASVDVGVPNVQFRYITDMPGRARLLGAITAWPSLGRLYGFDAWVANIDRHAGNLLFGSGAEAWLIDHGWAFTGPNWTSTSLDPVQAYPHRLSEWLTPHLTQDGREARTRQAGILEADLRLIDVNVAIEASRADLLLPPEDLRALKEFLTKRVNEVTRLASAALNSPVLI